jgi:hypothetical protein
MSRIIDFTTNSDKGFQLSDSVLNTLQTELQGLISGLEKRFGSSPTAGTVLSGCRDGNLDNTFDPGYVFWDEELFYFEGGAFNNFIIVSEVTTQLKFQDGNDYDAYTVRTLQFAAAIPGGGQGMAVTRATVPAQIDQFCYISRTFCQMDSDLTQAEIDITNSLTQTNITEVQDMLFEIGDARFIRDITNFTDGLGDAATNRENWVLVGDHVNAAVWKTALGLDPAVTAADIQRRGITIAALPPAAGHLAYGAFIGSDTVVIAEHNLPDHNHSMNSAITSDDGEHTHVVPTGIGAGEGYPGQGSPFNDYSVITNIGGAHSHSINGIAEGNYPNNPLDVRNRVMNMYMIVKYQ